jgi:hypothetical protein
VAKRFLRWLDPQGVSTLRRFFDALVGYGLLPANPADDGAQSRRRAPAAGGLISANGDAGAGRSPGGAAAHTGDPPFTVENPADQLAELYCVLEAVLPFAEVDVQCLALDVEDFPDGPEYAEDDAEELRRGREAIAAARRLIAKKPSYLAGDGKGGGHRP